MNPDLTLARPITTRAWPRDLPCVCVPATRSLRAPCPRDDWSPAGMLCVTCVLDPLFGCLLFSLELWVSNILCFNFWLYPTCGTLILQPGMEPMLPSLEGDVLTTRPLVKSLGINCYPFTPRGSLAKWLRACILALNYLVSSFACSYLGDKTVTPLSVPHFCHL